MVLASAPVAAPAALAALQAESQVHSAHHRCHLINLGYHLGCGVYTGGRLCLLHQKGGREKGGRCTRVHRNMYHEG